MISDDLYDELMSCSDEEDIESAFNTFENDLRETGRKVYDDVTLVYHFFEDGSLFILTQTKSSDPIYLSLPKAKIILFVNEDESFENHPHLRALIEFSEGLKNG